MSREEFGIKGTDYDEFVLWFGPGSAEKVVTQYDGMARYRNSLLDAVIYISENLNMVYTDPPAIEILNECRGFEKVMGVVLALDKSFPLYKRSHQKIAYDKIIDGIMSGSGASDRTFETYIAIRAKFKGAILALAFLGQDGLFKQYLENNGYERYTGNPVMA